MWLVSAGGTAYAASADDTISFQARLESSSGVIVADGCYNVQFQLYDAATGGSALWTESYTYDAATAGINGTCYPVNGTDMLNVVDGYLTVPLGSLEAFPDDISWNQPLYLTINIGGTNSSGPISYDGAMSPRLQLTAVPYAFAAGSVTSGSNSGGYTSALTLATPGSGVTGDETFTIPDQGTAGAYTLLTTNTANADYIQNTTTPQTASFDITGTGTAGTAILTPDLDAPTSGAALSIGGTNAGTVTIGNTTATAVTLQAEGISQTITGTSANPADTLKGTSTALFQVQDASGYADLTADTTDGQVILGNITTTSGQGVAGTLVLADGTADGYGAAITLAGTLGSSQAYDLPAAGGTFCLTSQNCGTAGSGYILNQSASPGTVQAGNLNISGTGIAGSLQVATSGSIDTSAAGTLNIGTATATTIDIATNAAAHTIVIGTGAAAQAITIGSASSASTTTIQGGTGTGAVQLQAATGGTISIGTTAADVITIGNTAGTSTLTLQGEGISDVITGSASAPGDVIETTTNAAGAFQIQDSAGYDVLSTSTSTGQTTLGSSSHVSGALAFDDSADTDQVSLSAGSGGTLDTNVTGSGTGTFGYSGANGGYSDDIYSDGNYMECTEYPFGSRVGATATSITTYTDANPGSGKSYGLAIYTGTGNQPTTKVASASGTLASTAGANTLSISATLTANTSYWLCENTNDSAAIWGTNPDNTYSSWYVGETYGTWPSTSTSPSGYPDQETYVISVNYTLSTASASTFQTVSNTGQETIQSIQDNATAFQVQDSSGDSILDVSTGGSIAGDGASSASVNVGNGSLNLVGLANPTGVTETASSSGGTYDSGNSLCYAVDAVDAQGDHTQAMFGTAQNDAADDPADCWIVMPSNTSEVTIAWNAVPDATAYTVYMTTNGTDWVSYQVGSGTTSVVDTGWTAGIFEAQYDDGDYANPLLYGNDTTGITLQAGTGIILDGGSGAGAAGLQYDDNDNDATLYNDNSGGQVLIQANSLAFEDTDAYQEDFYIDSEGETRFTPNTDTTATFQVQNADGSTVFNIDTTDNIVTLGNGSTTILVDGTLSAIKPGTTDTPETWHTMSVSGNGWTAGIPVPSYKLNAADTVSVCGAATHASFGPGSTLIGTVPSGYYPKEDQFIYSLNNSSGATTGAVYVTAAGDVYAWQFPSGTTSIYFCGSYPLDL